MEKLNNADQILVYEQSKKIQPLRKKTAIWGGRLLQMSCKKISNRMSESFGLLSGPAISKYPYARNHVEQGKGSPFFMKSRQCGIPPTEKIRWRREGVCIFRYARGATPR
jgi:hypothetical protein